MKIHGKTATDIFDSVRTLVQSRQLPPGALLPPVRDLAVSLGVNRNTVASAYRRLVTAGIALTQGRLGTVIRHHDEPGEQEGAATGSSLIDLASGNPNPAWLPDIAPALKIRPYKPRLYGEPTLNEGLARYARNWFKPDCPADFEVDLTHGAVDAIERLLNSYLVPGDKVAVENPCFLSSINTLRVAGLQPVAVAVDNEGMRPDGLEVALSKGVQAVILTPRAHNPTGCSLSEKRAKALSRVLARYPNVLVIMDDHFALLSNAVYQSVLPNSTYRWALVRSFTKALGPDLRIAALASDPATARLLRLRLASGTSWVSHLLQDIVEVTMGRPESAGFMAKARADYALRRKALEDALYRENIHFLADGDGLNLWVPVKGDDRAIASALARQGWLVRPGSAFCVQEPNGGLRVTISSIEPSQCAVFAQLVRRCLD